VSAQNHKFRAGLFGKWYIAAFKEVTGQFSIAIDTASYDFESYDEDKSGFRSGQYFHYYKGNDSLRLAIKINSYRFL